MRRKTLFLILLSLLLLCGCAKTSPEETETVTSAVTDDASTALPEQPAVPDTAAKTEAPKVSITKNPTGETVAEGENAVFIAKADHAEKTVWIAVSPDTKTEYELDEVPDAFEGIIAQYQEAIQNKYDTARMMELGLNSMIPECLKQDERASVGYSVFDMEDDGQTELVISASSESEYYTGLIFAVYAMEDGKPKLLLESGERSRWYYAGDGKLLYTTSSSASESGWYLCTADRELAYLDAIEYNAGEHPDDPWLKFTGETWEHTTQSEADRKIMELTNLVSNMKVTAFQSNE